MFKRTLSFILFSCVLLVGISCEEKSNPLYDEQTFTKIYSNNQFSTSYNPIEILQSDDDGYIILGERRLSDTTLNYTYLLKTDKYGNFVKDLEVAEDYINPVSQFSKIDGSNYFICMKGLSTQIAKFDDNLSSFEADSIKNNSNQDPDKFLPYPAVAYYDDNGSKFVVLNYDYANRQFVISLSTITGTLSNITRFDIEAANEIEGPIINHFLNTGKKFPFQVGRVPGGNYYFNGFYNYTLSLVFTNLNGDNSAVGVVQGQRENGGISAILPISNTKFAIARSNFGENYILPNASVTTSGTSSATDLNGFKFPELVPDAKVKIIQATIDSKPVLIYASNTKSKQIGLYFYDEATGELLGTKYLGFSNPFEVANLIQTKDNGLAVSGTTYVAGRFSRICLFKLSKAELEKIIK